MKPTKLILNLDCVQFSKLNRRTLYKGAVVSDHEPEVLKLVLSSGSSMSKDHRSGSDYTIIDSQECLGAGCGDFICDGNCAPLNFGDTSDGITDASDKDKSKTSAKAKK
jgi:hypothetical protein